MRVYERRSQDAFPTMGQWTCLDCMGGNQCRFFVASLNIEFRIMFLLLVSARFSASKCSITVQQSFNCVLHKVQKLGHSQNSCTLLFTGVTPQLKLLCTFKQSVDTTHQLLFELQHVCCGSQMAENVHGQFLGCHM